MRRPSLRKRAGHCGRRDIYLLNNVGDPQLSPDGAWVADTVTAIDSAKDKSDTDVWMTSWDVTQSIRLTSTPESEARHAGVPTGAISHSSAEDGQEGKGG